MVEESVYSFRKSLRAGSVNIQNSLTGQAFNGRPKHLAAQTGSKPLYSARPNKGNLNETSQTDFNHPALNGNVTGTESMFAIGAAGNRKTPGRNNTQWAFGATGMTTPVLPNLANQIIKTGTVSARQSITGQKFYATKQGSDSVGEKEDPRMARRLKLSQVQLLGDDGALQDDNQLARLLYGTQVHTQKNLIGAKTLRQSLAESLSGTEEKHKVPHVQLPKLRNDVLRMNRTSALSGFGAGGMESGQTPIKAN